VRTSHPALAPGALLVAAAPARVDAQWNDWFVQGLQEYDAIFHSLQETV
jgi:hypothetical protein